MKLSRKTRAKMEHYRRNILNVLILGAFIGFLVSVCGIGIELYDRAFLPYKNVKVSIEVSETPRGCIAKVKMSDGVEEIPIACEHKEAVVGITSVKRARTRLYRNWIIRIEFSYHDSNNSNLVQKGPGLPEPFFYTLV